MIKENTRFIHDMRLLSVDQLFIVYMNVTGLSSIQTGRQRQRQRQNDGVILNEYHFLLVCPKYRHLHKSKMLMYKESKNSSVSKYLYYAFRLRSN